MCCDYCQEVKPTDEVKQVKKNCGRVTSDKRPTTTVELKNGKEYAKTDANLDRHEDDVSICSLVLCYLSQWDETDGVVYKP